MPYCPGCGTELPADANFCPKCGRPQAAPPPAPAPDDPGPENWEECEIVAVVAGEKWSPVFPSEMIQFKAEATGPKSGAYTAKESPQLKAGLADYYQPNKANKRHAQAVEELTAVLAADGWERAGKGAAWFSRRFRRRLS